MKVKSRRLVQGVGVNDVDYVVKNFDVIKDLNGKRKLKLAWACPYYLTWLHMLERCYSKKYKERYPTYTECTVCDAWLKLSNFKAWMETQNHEGKHLDKDILCPGNKVYSPETCVFIDHVINSFVIECNSTRGKWPIGASWDKGMGRFKAQCRNPFTNVKETLGYFNCPDKAHHAWLTRKLELAKLLAEGQQDTRVAKALIKRYENYGG